ncbi:hypothetical protein VINE108274_06135 [Vibrio neptunius]
MFKLFIIKHYVAADLKLSFTMCRVCFQLNLLIFHTSPASFDKNVIDPATSSIRVAPYAIGSAFLCEPCAVKMAALI